MVNTPNIRGRTALLALGILLFTGAILWFVLSYIGKSESTVKKLSNQFIEAVEKNDPDAAPENTDDYVRGIWRVYGRVNDAELVKTENVRVGSGKQATTHYETNVLLRTRRGLAVLELEFASGGFKADDQSIIDIEELDADDIPGDAVDDKTLARVKSDQKERGEPASSIDLSRAGQGSPQPASGGRQPKRAKPPKPAKPKQPAVIRCIRRAHGDVTKIQRCAKLAPGQ